MDHWKNGATMATTASGPATGHGLTVSTGEGPYYVIGAALVTSGKLNYTDLPGDPIKIVGHVYSGTDTSKPLAAAKIEIWQADSDGVYHPEGNGHIGKYAADEIALRGHVLTDGSGAFQFTTIYPGHY